MWKIVSVAIIVLLGLKLGGVKTGGGLMLCGVGLLWMDQFLRGLGKKIDLYPGNTFWQKTVNWFKTK